MLILEFTQDRVKLLVAVKKGQGFSLTKMSKRPINGLSDDEISGALEALLNESGVKKTSPLIISIPRHLFTVRSLRLPAVDEAELKDMAALQAGKQLPYPADELIWDFIIIEKRPDGYSDIALILGHRNVLDKYINILKKAGLEPDKAVISSEALYGWYFAASGFKEAEELKGQQTRAIADIDTSHIDIIIVRDGILDFSRSFLIKDDLQEMVEEIRKTFYSYEKENSKTIDSVILTGIEQRASSLKPLLAGVETTNKPAEFVHPLRAASSDYREGLSDFLEVSRDASFACSLGLAYNPQILKMDFLPPELKKQKLLREKKKRFIKTAVLAGAVFLAFAGLLSKDFMYRSQEYSLLNTKIKETDPKVKRLKEISQQISIVKQSLDMRGSSVDILREIFKIVPPEVSISVLDFELQKSLAIRGISTNMSGVFKFASEIKKSKYFKASEIKYAQKRVIKEKEFVDYEINCTLDRILK